MVHYVRKGAKIGTSPYLGEKTQPHCFECLSPCCFIVTLPFFPLPCLFWATNSTGNRPSINSTSFQKGKRVDEDKNPKKEYSKSCQTRTTVSSQYLLKLSKVLKWKMSKDDAKYFTVDFASQHKVNSAGPHDVNQIVQQCPPQNSKQSI